MATKENENGLRGGFQYRQPVHRTKWQNLKKALYDPSTGEILGRTGKSWGQLLIFYSIFYVVLAALFAMCMQGLLATLDDDAPKWQLERSLIGTNPGMGFRPISERTEEGSLISYVGTNETTRKKWVDLLDKFLESYTRDQHGENFENCQFGSTVSPDHVCSVDLENFGPCSPSHAYGYNSTSPCVFLKLNKIYGWTPDYITEPVDSMPVNLTRDIKEFASKNKTQVWVSCEGEGPPDKENIQSFEYYPTRGFPSYYFPYTNTKNYLSPVIAVRIIEPTPHVIVNIECKAWAKNIIYRGGNLQREGSVQFEVLID